MKWKPWLKLLALVLVPVAVSVAAWVLAFTASISVSQVVAGAAGVMYAAWALYAGMRTIQGDGTRLAKYIQAAVETLVALQAVAAFNWAFTEDLQASEASWIAVGVAGLIWVFMLLLTLARWLLSFGAGPLGVARVVLDEAIRMKVALVFIVLLLVIIPILPMALDADDPLRYRVQTFLSWGLIVTMVLLSLMTIFLACATLANEIRDKQIFTITTKPVGRTTYLFGKWLGICTLNAVLLTVAATAIYAFAVLYLARQQPKDLYDGVALREHVLTARVSANPDLPEDMEERVEARFQNMLNQSPELVERAGGEEAARRQVRQQVVAAWQAIGPLETETYVFSDLKPVADRWAAALEVYSKQLEEAQAANRPQPPLPPRQYIQMRYKIEVSQDVNSDTIDLLFRFNGNVEPVRMVVGMAQVVPVPADYLTPEGVLVIDVRSPSEGYPTVLLDPRQGLQLLYEVDNFTSNYIRGIAAIGVKLAFLAMLGLMAASFLGFAVACVLSLLVFFAASVSPFLLDAAGSFGQKPENIAQRIIYEVLRAIAYLTAKALEKFAEYGPIEKVVDGLLYSWGELLGCVVWVGLVWTGVAALIAALVFRNRELARVQV